jgi:outer membrane protein assembly complex protein YaeT
MSRRSHRLLVLPLLLLFSGACKEEGGVKVSSFKFNGNQAVTEGQLKSVIATQASSKIPWGTKRYFSREQFEADLKRITAFYTDRGFPDARITSFDVNLSEDQTSVDISLNIDEGEPIRVERIEFEGFDSLWPTRRATLEERMPLKEGAPLDRALLQASREFAIDELRERGHAYASVQIVEGDAAGERARAITFRADPGPLARHGEIEISGNSSVSDNVVRRQLTFREGDLFRQSRLGESQRRLYNLEVFQFANIEPVRTDEKSEIVPTRVTVTEGKHRKVNFSVGYGTEEKARTEVNWRHVNFFGGARTAGVEARYSGLDRGVRLNFNQPYLFSPRYSLGSSAHWWHAAEPAFTLDTLGGRVTVTRQIVGGRGRLFAGRPTTTFSATYLNEQDDYTISQEALNDPTFRPTLIALGLDPDTGEGGGQRSAVVLEASRNTTDNILNARRGYLAALHLEQAGSVLGGSYNYTEFTGEGRYYHQVGNVVLAVQGRGGSINANGAGSFDANVPFFKRYFLGGATNLRGWGRYEVGPLSGTGLPIGGATFTYFSAEVRMPLWRDLGGVVFVDGGNAWAGEWNFDLNDMRYDVGPGLRYNTPIGPIRADLGYQLNPIPGLAPKGELLTRRFRFHFSSGQAF